MFALVQNSKCSKNGVQSFFFFFSGKFENLLASFDVPEAAVWLEKCEATCFFASKNVTSTGKLMPYLFAEEFALIHSSSVLSIHVHIL